MQISYDLGYFIEYADGVHDPDSACWASLLSTNAYDWVPER
jgi:hypothetical protein